MSVCTEWTNIVTAKYFKSFIPLQFADSMIHKYGGL